MGIVLVDRHHAIVLRLLNVHQLGRSNDAALTGYQVVNPVIALAELCTDSETVVIRLAFAIEITVSLFTYPFSLITFHLSLPTAMV